MKKFTKICLIIAAVCLVFGIGLTTAAGAMGVRFRDLPVVHYANNWGHWGNNWEWYDWDEEWDKSWEQDWDNWEDDWDDWEQEMRDELDEIPRQVEEEVSAAMEDFDEEMKDYWKDPIQVVETLDFTGVRKLDVDISVGGVQIIAVEADDTDGELVGTGSIRVKVGSSKENEKYRVYLDDGDKLCVETKWSKRNNYTNTLKRGRRIQILVPKGYQFDDVDVTVNAGALEADEIWTRSMDATMNAGKMTIHNGTVEELDSKINAGQLTYQGSVSRSLEGECNAGSLELLLDGKKEDFNYEVKAAAGAVTIGDESYASLKGQKIKNNGAIANMELFCMAGAVRVSFTE